MVQYRICSDFCYYDLTVLFCFQILTRYLTVGMDLQSIFFRIFFRIGTYFPPRLEVSYVFGVPISSGATSTSLSSSSVSVSAVLPFWTILSFPFRVSRSISSQRPYFPSRPRRQCRFFGLISPLALIVDSFFALRLV